jgi:hypothetical protein
MPQIEVMERFVILTAVKNLVPHAGITPFTYFVVALKKKGSRVLGDEILHCGQNDKEGAGLLPSDTYTAATTIKPDSPVLHE